MPSIRRAAIDRASIEPEWPPSSQPTSHRASSPRVATEQPDHAAIEQRSSSPCATTEQSHNSHRAAIERPAIEQAAIKQPTSSHRASSHQAANKQPSRKQPSSYEQLSSSPCAATERPPNSHRTATEQPSSKQPSSKQLSRSQQAAIEQAATEWPPRSRIKQPSSSYRAAATGRPPNSHRTATEQLSSEEEQPLSRPCAATEQPLCGHRATTEQRPARSRRSRRSPGLRASEGRAQRAVRARGRRAHGSKLWALAHLDAKRMSTSRGTQGGKCHPGAEHRRPPWTDMERGGSGSGHGPPVTVQTEKFCTFFAREVKMKCPKSEEFFGVNT